MSHIYLDAYLFTCPEPQKGPQIFIQYIENLISWHEIKKADWVEVCISRNASEVLAEANAFPPYSQINEALNDFSITHIQARDVGMMITSFLTKSKTIEEELDIDDLLFEDLTINPRISFDDRPILFKDHINLLTVLIALHNRYCSQIDDQYLITNNDINYNGIVAIEARIPILQTKSTRIIPDEEAQPFNINSQFNFINCLHTLHLSISPFNIWSQSKCENAQKKAIELFIYQHEHCSSPYKCPVDYNAFSFGEHFVQSCRELGFFHEKRKIMMLLRACSETLLQVNIKDVHWIRKGSGPESPQLKRGNDGAWRRDIDHEFHLHYWQTSRGPQFANVVLHKDLTIL